MTEDKHAMAIFGGLFPTEVHKIHGRELDLPQVQLIQNSVLLHGEQLNLPRISSCLGWGLKLISRHVVDGLRTKVPVPMQTKVVQVGLKFGNGYHEELSIPITGIKTLHMQWSLGFYFKVCKKLYTVIVRHVLFPSTQGNQAYNYPHTYTESPRKDVVVMGNKAFNNFLASIQVQIGMLKGTLKVLNKNVTSLRDRQANGNQVAVKLVRTVADVMEKEQMIAVLKDFWAMMKSKWSSPNNHIIEMTPSLSLTIQRIAFTTSPTFSTPRRSSNLNNDLVCFIIKNGYTTGTTIGHLNSYESFEHQYSIGTFNSIEAAVYPYDTDSTAFSCGGDSGAIIISAKQDFVTLLTSSSGPSKSSNITYATPFSWLWWNIVKPKFSGAMLFFNPIPNN
ncbi:hypothetical protein BD769DRAFT_1382436 [Suillus cothurnatus]|nr:hypothetical protein BD769DRAFT_1382436 [Suillus cothurnatus]